MLLWNVILVDVFGACFCFKKGFVAGYTGSYRHFHGVGSGATTKRLLQQKNKRWKNCPKIKGITCKIADISSLMSAWTWTKEPFTFLLSLLQARDIFYCFEWRLMDKTGPLLFPASHCYIQGGHYFYYINFSLLHQLHFASIFFAFLSPQKAREGGIKDGGIWVNGWIDILHDDIWLRLPPKQKEVGQETSGHGT